jgi:hypothetical protein
MVLVGPPSGSAFENVTRADRARLRWWQDPVGRGRLRLDVTLHSDSRRAARQAPSRGQLHAAPNRAFFNEVDVLKRLFGTTWSRCPPRSSRGSGAAPRERNGVGAGSTARSRRPVQISACAWQEADPQRLDRRIAPDPRRSGTSQGLDDDALPVRRRRGRRVGRRASCVAWASVLSHEVAVDGAPPPPSPPAGMAQDGQAAAVPPARRSASRLRRPSSPLSCRTPSARSRSRARRQRQARR